MSVDKDTEKLEPFCTAGGNVKWWKAAWQLLRKLDLRYQITHNSPSRYIFKRNKNIQPRKMCTRVYTRHHSE